MATMLASSPLGAMSSGRPQYLTPHSPPQQHRQRSQRQQQQLQQNQATQLQQSPEQPELQRVVSRHRFVTDFSQCLFDFVIQLLPTTEEMAVKEDVRKLLERLIRTIEPDSRLLSFGSSANGLGLKNSDMDLCCVIDSGERLNASDLVTMVGDLLERETKFHVKPLPHARIPIVKLTLDPSPALPFGIACDIGFENRLALENTRLLLCYAAVDPARVRTMVLFLKVWSKRRKINSPYKGTLSSYGYVLLVIYFLVHVKSPPVLPNLQSMPPLRPISEEDTHLNGHNIWFFDDIELLRQRWKSSNTDTVAELLMDFFKYYSRDFAYNTGVASIRSGLLRKDSKGWNSEPEFGSTRERNRLAIEDPFETEFNVARCVTKDGLYTIRGEFMRASRILQTRPERAILALAELCEERKDETLGPPPPGQRAAGTPPRLNAIPPQTPYTVGSSPMRPIGVPVPAPEDISPAKRDSDLSCSPPMSSPGSSSSRVATLQPHQIPIRLPVDNLDHMAPIRSKWTSPPPPEAPEEVHSAFEDRLGLGIALATASNGQPQLLRNAYASSANSEVFTDDEGQSMTGSDDAQSVRSWIEEGEMYRRERERQFALLHQQHLLQQHLQQQFGFPIAAASRADVGLDWKMMNRLRGRPAARLGQQTSPGHVNGHHGQTRRDGHGQNGFTPPPRMETPRRSLSFPVQNINRFSMPAMNAFANPLAAYHVASPIQPSPPRLAARTNSNVYYEASPARERAPYILPMGYSTSPQQLYASPSISPQQLFDRMNSYDSAHSDHSPSSSPRQVPITIRRAAMEEEPVAGPSRLRMDSSSSSPSSPNSRLFSHQHSHSNTTIVAPTPPASSLRFSPSVATTPLPPSLSRSHSPSNPGRPMPRPYPYPTHSQLPPRLREEARLRSMSPYPSVSSASGSGSPPMSCNSSQYAPSSSPLSTSPPSPVHSDKPAKQGSPHRAPLPAIEIGEEPDAPPVRELEKTPGPMIPSHGLGEEAPPPASTLPAASADEADAAKAKTAPDSSLATPAASLGTDTTDAVGAAAEEPSVGR